MKPPMPPPDDCDRRAESITVRLNLYNFYVNKVLRPEKGTSAFWLHIVISSRRGLHGLKVLLFKRNCQNPRNVLQVQSRIPARNMNPNIYIYIYIYCNKNNLLICVDEATTHTMLQGKLCGECNYVCTYTYDSSEPFIATTSEFISRSGLVFYDCSRKPRKFLAGNACFYIRCTRNRKHIITYIGYTNEKQFSRMVPVLVGFLD